MRLSRLYNL